MRFSMADGPPTRASFRRARPLARNNASTSVLAATSVRAARVVRRAALSACPWAVARGRMARGLRRRHVRLCVASTRRFVVAFGGSGRVGTRSSASVGVRQPAIAPAAQLAHAETRAACAKCAAPAAI